MRIHFGDLTVTTAGLAALAIILICFGLGFYRGFIREALSALMLLLSIVVVWFTNPYVNDFLRTKTPVYEKVAEGSRGLVEAVIKKEEISSLGAEGQQQVISGLNLPSFLEDALLTNNTAQTYAKLQVEKFTDYVADYLTETAVNGLSFIVSFVLAQVLLRLLFFALNSLAQLPGIHAVNRAAGGLLGAMKSVAVIWIILLVMTVFCSYEPFAKGLEMVRADTVLNTLYENNPFTEVFMNIGYAKGSH